MFPSGYAAGPIILRFHSDDIIEPEQELGFDITYRQLGTGCMRPLRWMDSPLILQVVVWLDTYLLILGFIAVCKTSKMSGVMWISNNVT